MPTARQLAIILILSTGCSKPAPTTPITIDGSSTVYPLTLNAKSAERPEVKAFVRTYVRSARDLAPQAGAVPMMPSTHRLVEDRFARLTTGTIFDVPNIADAWLDLLLTQ